MAEPTQIESIEGRGCVLRGDDIDTDRIIPARFMKVVTFDGLGEHAFEDDRKAAKGDHALDDSRFEGASIMIVGRNFGCGSSREHAPQALLRAGFSGFIGSSFAEIFAGNCTSLGLVCITLEEADLEQLRESVELDPTQTIRIDVADRTVSSNRGEMRGQIPDGTHEQLLCGQWDALGMLLSAGSEIEATEARLRYGSSR
ncbi:3-isopropylmalate dehydratase small subunit [Myxococcota bacterium]|nr:3-isopropylmalate dehydratase small subunit [Myxococcota bacterium]